MGIQIFKRENWDRWENGPYTLTDFLLDPVKDRFLAEHLLRNCDPRRRVMLLHRYGCSEVPEAPANPKDPADQDYARYLLLREQVMREDDYWTLKAAILDAPDIMMRRFAFCRLTGCSWPTDSVAYGYQTYACGLKTGVSREDIEDLCRELVYKNGRYAKRAAEWLEKLPAVSDGDLAEWASEKTERKYDRTWEEGFKKRLRPASGRTEREDLEDKLLAIFDAYIFRRYQRHHLNGSGVVLLESAEDPLTRYVADWLEKERPYNHFETLFLELMRAGGRELLGLTEREIHDIAWSVSPRSRQHSFYLWMAWWYGIDADEDDDKALKLLADAAERGHLYACEVIANIYASGKYVRRDFRMALQWQEKKVGLLRKAYEASDDRDRRCCASRDDYARVLRETGDLLKREGRDKRAKQYYRQAEQIEAAGEKAQDP